MTSPGAARQQPSCGRRTRLGYVAGVPGSPLNARARTTAGAGLRAALVLLAASWVVVAGPPVAAAGVALASAGAAAGSQPSPPDVKRPNDPLFAYQWHLPAIQIPAAWAISRGAGATVAILDTGVAFEDRGPYRRAPDLAGTRFVAGWDFVDDDPHPDDVPPRDGRRSHGTLMAGLVAQTTGNALGGAGVAPDATIMPVRVLRPDLSGSARAIARGLRFAVDHGADVVNMSIAGRSPSRVLTAAIAYAAARDVTVVAAAGNDGLASVSWPAADPRVIAVGAVRRDLTRASYSNYGASLDLVAPAGAGDRVDSGRGPGDGVLAQTLKDGPARFCFCFTASTSAAAAQVSGVVALLIGAGRATSRADVRAALLSGARDLGARGRDPEYGAGLVQAWRALALTRPMAAAPPARDRDPGSPSRSWRTVLWIVLAVGVGVACALAIRRRHRGAI